METTRRHDLDWLRLIAILILLFFHTGMLFNTWGWHIKNSETTVSFQYWMIWSHYFRMPLLLFISGAGTYMALGKRTKQQYVGERFRRLFIPLLFGMFVVVPPQIYYEHINDYATYGDFYKTVFQFVPYPHGSFSWHHLWFVFYLLVYSLIALPLLSFLRSPASDILKEQFARLAQKPVLLLMLPGLLIFLSQGILRPFFPEETHDFIHDWAYFTQYFSFFAFGMIAYSSPRLWQAIGDNRKALLWGTFIALIPFYTCYFNFRGFFVLPWTPDTAELVFDIIAIFVGWFTVITIIAYGQHHLNRPHPWLKYFNEGLYPFYILHQTVIIAIGYYICQLPWGIALKFWVVSALTLTSCVVFYLLIIRPFGITRLLFGLKALPPKSLP